MTVNRSLEALRGLAALLVVTSHCRLYPYTAAGIPATGRSMAERILLVPSSFGRESVAIFFVLSGYLVGGQTLRQVRQARFDASDFLRKRLTRCWAVLLPGLAITALIDSVTRSIATDGVFRGAADRSIGTMLCNAVFEMDGRCPTYGSNESLWSLGYEFWFYIVFAAACVAISAAARRRFAWSVGCCAIIALVLAGYGPHLLLLIPAWLFGVLVAVYQPAAKAWSVAHRRHARVALGGAATVFFAGLLAAMLHDSSLPTKYLLLGVTSSPLVLMLAATDPRPRRGARVESCLVWLGGWSFTLYVFHLPVVTLATTVMADEHVVPNVGIVYGLLAVVVASVYPFYWLGEAHTASLRHWVVRASTPNGVTLPPHQQWTSTSPD